MLRIRSRKRLTFSGLEELERRLLRSGAPGAATPLTCELSQAPVLEAGATAISATPGPPELLPAYDTGVSDSDNLTMLDNSSAEKALRFSVPGTVPGATVALYADGVLIGLAVADDTVTTVTSDGWWDLSDGAHLISARQTEPGKLESPDSYVPGTSATIINVKGVAAPVEEIYIDLTDTLGDAWWSYKFSGGTSADVLFSSGTSYTLNETIGQINAAYKRTVASAHYDTGLYYLKITASAAGQLGEVNYTYQESGAAHIDILDSTSAGAANTDWMFIDGTDPQGTPAWLDVDTQPPTVDALALNRGASQRSKIRELSIDFAGDPWHISGAAVAALQLHDDTHGQDVDLSAASWDHDDETETTTWDLSGVDLLNAFHTARVVASDVTDLAGNELDGNGDGVGGDDFTYQFVKSAGDANGDALVNVGDLGILGANYGSAGNWWELLGDLNADGNVSVGDLGILGANYGTKLTPPGGGCGVLGAGASGVSGHYAAEAGVIGSPAAGTWDDVAASTAATFTGSQVHAGIASAPVFEATILVPLRQQEVSGRHVQTVILGDFLTQWGEPDDGLSAVLPYIA